MPKLCNQPFPLVRMKKNTRPRRATELKREPQSYSGFLCGPPIFLCGSLRAKNNINLKRPECYSLQLCFDFEKNITAQQNKNKLQL
jgi:hypothetical protein